MKQKVLKLMVLSMAMLFSASVNAQSDLGSVLGNVLGAATGNASSSSGGDLISTLTSVFSSDKQASKNNIIGTWSYTEPAIVFTSDNILAQAASKIAANKLESKLQGYLTKYGIKPGTFTMTFKEDGTYTRTLNGRTSRGTWTIKDSKLMLTIAGIKTVAITTQIDGKDMQFVTDATKLLNFFKTMGAKSTNANLQTITSLMKSVKGMQAGITLHKQ
jgi:hypothetical protein